MSEPIVALDERRPPGGQEWRAAALLRSGATHEQLREQLRQAIVLRDAANQAVAAARAELNRVNGAGSDALLTVAAFGDLDAERAAARVAAVRAGLPATDHPDLVARFAERDAARLHFADLSQAAKAIQRELADAEAAAAQRQVAVEALVAAVVASEIERLADRLAEMEAAAAALRGTVASVAGNYMTGRGFSATFPLPITERTKALLRCPPANAVPRSDNPALRREDDRTRAAYRAHAEALLKDADAPLAAALPA